MPEHDTFDHCNTNAAAGLEAGQILQTLKQQVQILGDGGIPFIINAEGKPVSLEEYQTKPFRHKAAPVFADALSFIQYINIYKGPGALIFGTVNENGGTFYAALDLAGMGETSWNDHSATFTLANTADWKAWIAGNKKWLKQEDFVLFVESMGHTFYQPSGATMLEIAMSLEATIKGNYKSSFRAQNGDRTLVLDMSTDASFGSGESKITVPREFTIVIAPFEGQNAYQQKAFLRFRPHEGGVMFQYELQRVDETIRNSALEARTRIASETTLPVLNGSLARR